MDNPFNTFLPFNIKLKLLQLFKLKCLLRGIHLQKPSFLLRKQTNLVSTQKSIHFEQHNLF